MATAPVTELQEFGNRSVFTGRFCPVVLLVLAGLGLQPQVRGDSSGQLWANITLGKLVNQRSYLELDFEPKVQVSGDSSWRNLDVTGLYEYYPSGWIDLTGELTLGRTHQLDGLNTFEVTPRVGLRIHFLKQVFASVKAETDPDQGGNGSVLGIVERVPLERFDIALYLRIEYRNFHYSDDSASEHSWRMRGRLESKAALNQRALSEIGVLYGIADLEQYFPMGEDITESFPNKTRGRIGLGYRARANHRVELLFIRDWNIDSTDGEGTIDTNSLDLRWKIQF